MLKVILLCFIFTYFSFPVANGELVCYSCIMNGGEADDSCVKNPANVITSSPTVKCQSTQKYCTIERLEYSDPPGQIFTFLRGCATDDNSGVTEGGGFKKYIRVCTTRLCNDWDGISSGGGSGGGGGGGSGGSGGSGGGDGSNGSDNGPWFILGTGGAGKQRVDLYVVFITFSVVLKLYQ